MTSRLPGAERSISATRGSTSCGRTRDRAPAHQPGGVAVIPLPQIEIIHCLQEDDMADEKDKKPKDQREPVEQCPKPDGEVRPASGGGGTGGNPPTPPKPQ